MLAVATSGVGGCNVGLRGLFGQETRQNREVIHKTNRLGNHTSLTQPVKSIDSADVKLLMLVNKDVCILAEGAIELSVTLSGGALFAS